MDTKPPTHLAAGDAPRNISAELRLLEVTAARIEHAIDRLIRVETRICALMRHHGLDSQGRPLAD